MKFLLLLLILFGELQLTCFAIGQKTGSDYNKLLYGFTDLQDSAQTKTWWFHGKYPSDKNEMRKDLESFKSAGLGGVVWYDQVHGDVSSETEKVFSKEWWDNIYFAARETKRLGLDFEFHVSNGFVAGGPWIGPSAAMKRLDCIESIITGGKEITVKLNVPHNRYNYFSDVKLLAIPTSDNVKETMKIYSPNFKGDACRLFQNDSLYTISPMPDKTPVIIDLDFQSPVVLQNISYKMTEMGKATTSATNVPGKPQESFVGTGYYQLHPIGTLQYSEDGEVYHKVCNLKPLYKAHENYKRKTISFFPVKARYFRILLQEWDGSNEGKPLKIGGFRLKADPMINEYEYKTGLISDYIEKTMDSPSLKGIPHNSIIDLTSKLDQDGILRWNAPTGKWKLLRFCMVPTGATIKHGRKDMPGLECDKMSVEATTLQFNSYFRQILDSLDYHHINNLKGMTMDSHEAGAQNWTDDFLREFKTRRGYDLTRFLPVMAGYIVDNTKTSEAVLYDVRLTISDLIADRYYGTFDKLCRERGIVFTAQATGNAQCIVAIPIVAKSKVQKPQGEFWVIHPNGNYDIKEASSAAHLYNKPIASAEAFTDANATTMPSDLKNIADAAYAFGINEFVICASAHQPDEQKPGNPAGRCYGFYSRNNTWWPYSQDFWDYQTRVSYLMRQGRPVIDLCIYLGNNAPVRILTHRLPVIPSGYDFDAFTEDALLTRMEVINGRIELSSGQHYSMMVLPRSGEISLDALKKIASLTKKGALVYGNRPTGSPCKKDIGKEKQYFDLVAELWDSPNYGQGKVYSGMPLAEALSQAGITPDIKGKKLYFSHRETDDCDLYFLNNHTDHTIADNYVFKTRYHKAQLWDPTSGKRFALSMKNGKLPLKLSPKESCIIVFTDKEEHFNSLPPVFDESRKKVLDKKWNIYFDPQYQGAGKIECPTLQYWNESSNPDIRFYSGKATYNTWFRWEYKSSRALLQLPANNNLVVVYLNDKKVGSIWCSPWNLDISAFIKTGKNNLRLEVINAWNNRCIGDLLHPSKNQVTVNPEQVVKATDPLINAGLAGEITLLIK